MISEPKYIGCRTSPYNPVETSGWSAPGHLESLRDHAPDLRLDTVLADPTVVDDVEAHRVLELAQRHDDLVGTGVPPHVGQGTLRGAQ